MFTGIVKATGSLARIEQRGGDCRLSLRASGLPWRDYATGDSIAVNGVCLTAIELLDDGFVTDVSRETLAVTTLGGLGEGARVNLEPALAVGERLGGHLVSGHVDGVATVCSRQPDARAERFEFELPAELARYVARKGSITIDGVSLTVNAVSGCRFDVAIIPHTLAETTIGDYHPGTRVNIEVDLLARYLERLLGADGDPAASGITAEFLKAHGYG